MLWQLVKYHMYASGTRTGLAYVIFELSTF